MSFHPTVETLDTEMQMSVCQSRKIMFSSMSTYIYTDLKHGGDMTYSRMTLCRKTLTSIILRKTVTQENDSCQNDTCEYNDTHQNDV